jgi:hypothetical protein
MAASVAQIFVVDFKESPVTGNYAFHQGKVIQKGKLAGDGSAPFGKIDPKRAFVFEVRDRVCAIRAGAFLNPDDPRIEYGGTWFDWALVRDNVDPDTRFWPHYKKEMNEEPRASVDCFMQHEHVTCRPIQVAKPVLSGKGKVVIRATPARIRVGPFVRYTDDTRAVIWLETVTPTMVRARYRKAGATTDSSRYDVTVRVGGRYFAAVEIDGLTGDTFYDYTIELAPLPATGVPKNVEEAFPPITPDVKTSIEKLLTDLSMNATPWLTFRTLRRTYDKHLRFATGSCRWYPGDADHKGKRWGPDMFVALGNWLRSTAKDKARLWPHFMFLGGDQIYADEIGLTHGEKLIAARFASRIPGPADSSPLRDKLVDGAWAGRFAHRFRPYKDPKPDVADSLRRDLEELDKLHTLHPDLKKISDQYPEVDRRKALKTRYETVKTRRQSVQGAHTEAGDERKTREALNALIRVDQLEIKVESRRAAELHWRAAKAATWRHPMSARFLVNNFALWSIPDSDLQLPTVANQGEDRLAAIRSDAHGHPAAERGLHAADFAEYAFLYQYAWTKSTAVRRLLAHVPTFLMFDDHEVTDDWNFDTGWVRMLHNPKDSHRMWPKTVTDGLAAYWMYQGWCNKAPSQWSAKDPRVEALAKAKETGKDALPQLRKLIHAACLSPAPPADPAAAYQAGLSLDWHYRLPFDPPFLVPDCRSRRRMVPNDDKIRIIDHSDAKRAPQSQTIDDAQIKWMRRILVDEWRGGPVVFIAPSTPLLMQDKIMSFMTKPEVAAGAWARENDLAGVLAALFSSTKLGMASNAVLRIFRRRNDIEHMVRDRSWRDIWAIVDDMAKRGSVVKTLVLVSGDVHHNYCMTANASGSGRPRPEIVQITASGFQTTIRGEFSKWIAEQLSSLPFDLAKRRLVPGFVLKDGTGGPGLVLYENTAAIVDVKMDGEVDVAVTYLTGDVDPAKQVRQIFKYTSGGAYLKKGQAAVAGSSA